MDDLDRKVYKDGIGLNDKVTVELPVAVILLAVNSYAEAEWSSGAVSQLMLRCQEKIIDPVYWNETQAAHQEAHDRAEAMQQHMMHQILPQIMPGDPRLDEQ